MVQAFITPFRLRRRRIAVKMESGEDGTQGQKARKIDAVRTCAGNGRHRITQSKQMFARALGLSVSARAPQLESFTEHLPR